MDMRLKTSDIVMEMMEVYVSASAKVVHASQMFLNFYNMSAKKLIRCFEILQHLNYLFITGKERGCYIL